MTWDQPVQRPLPGPVPSEALRIMDLTWVVNAATRNLADDYRAADFW